MGLSVIEGLDPAAYRRHALHDPARAWPETNCYVDLLIEVLAQNGHEPRAMLGFTLAQDHEGDHFTFFKPPAADLARLYGIEVMELAIFDRLEGHLLEQVKRRRLPLVEVDSWYLPDTTGVSYRLAHGKTTIGVNRIDPAARRLDYFHNAGYFRLEGEDYDALIRPERADGLPLFPYAEVVKFGAGGDASLDTARALLAHHLARRPARNPFCAWAARLPEELDRLARRPPAWFHAYAFNTLRQAGANFGLLATHLAWLGEAGEGGLEPAGEAAQAIADAAKVMQFQLARAVARGRFEGFGERVARMADAYESCLDVLDRRYDAAPARAA